jgi:peptide deformylase
VSIAVRQVLPYGTDSLREPSQEVHKISKKIQDLITDLTHTMYASNAVGLAAPQIGTNYRVFVIDTSPPESGMNPIVFINPKIVKKSGGFVAKEGCISFPEVYTEVRRFKKLLVKALDKSGKPFVMEADGGLLASVLQHENDHLDGILFIDHCQNRFDVDTQLKKYDLPPVQEEKLITNDWEQPS